MAFRDVVRVEVEMEVGGAKALEREGERARRRQVKDFMVGC